ncbi:amino acid permease, partial [Kyrpidia sp.]|uniref:APC family permease n=1 Tax=Kyrpidia sp. TaxID=2073077 RepID=UPI00258D6784
FGPIAGRVTGWMFLGTVPVGAPLVALVGAQYVASVIPMPPVAVTGLAALLLGVSLWLNAGGVELSSRVQMGVVGLIALLLGGAVVLSLPYMEISDFRLFAPRGWLHVGTAGLLVFWCFVGWEVVAHLAEEFRQPQRDVPLSLVLAALIVGALYTATALVTVGTGAYGQGGGLTPLRQLVARGFGHLAGDVTAGLALFISFGTIHTNIAGFSRMVYARAREGDFPRVFAVLHPVSRTPRAALVGLGTAFAAVLSFCVVFRPNLGNFMLWPGVAFLVLYTVTMAAALKLLPKGDPGRPMAAISFAVCVGLYPFSGWACLYPATLAAVGALTGLVALRRRRQTGSRPVAASTREDAHSSRSKA